jgi:hypothetical protein
MSATTTSNARCAAKREPIEDASAPSSEPHGSEIKRLQAHIDEQEVHRGGF